MAVQAVIFLYPLIILPQLWNVLTIKTSFYDVFMQHFPPRLLTKAVILYFHPIYVDHIRSKDTISWRVYHFPPWLRLMKWVNSLNYVAKLSKKQLKYTHTKISNTCTRVTILTPFTSTWKIIFGKFKPFKMAKRKTYSNSENFWFISQQKPLNGTRELHVYAFQNHWMHIKACWFNGKRCWYTESAHLTLYIQSL